MKIHFRKNLFIKKKKTLIKHKKKKKKKQRTEGIEPCG